MTRNLLLTLVVGSFVAAGCSSQPRVTGNPVLVNPEDVSPEIGGTDEILNVSEQAVASLLDEHPYIAEGKDSRPFRIVLDRIVDKTGIQDYDERILYNRFLTQLTRSGRGKFAMLSRQAVRAERAAQASGEVDTAGHQGKLAGADYALTVELRTLPGARSQTIQYFFQLTGLDGVLVWSDDKIYKKRR